MKVNGKFTKNMLIAEYHSEEFSESVEYDIPDDSPQELVLYEIARAGAMCEKVVFLKLLMRNMITTEKYNERDAQISKELKLLRNAANEALAKLGRPPIE